MKNLCNNSFVRAIITTFVLLFLSVLPICPIIWNNLHNDLYIFKGVSLSLYLSLLYSLITPGFVGIIRRDDYNIFHKSVILVFTVILVLAMGVTLEKSIFIQEKNQYYEFYILIFTLVLLFFNSYKKEKDSSTIFDIGDEKLQKNIKKYSKNLKSEDDHNE